MRHQSIRNRKLDVPWRTFDALIRPINSASAPSLKEYFGQVLRDEPAKKKEDRENSPKIRLKMNTESVSEEEVQSFEAFLADQMRRIIQGKECKLYIQDIINSGSSDKSREARKTTIQPVRNGKRGSESI